MSSAKRIQNILSEVSGLPVRDFSDIHSQLTPDKLDSLEYLEAIVKIESAFSIEFSDAEIPNLTSIQAIVGKLNTRISGEPPKRRFNEELQEWS